MARIALLSTSDTDLLSGRASGAGYILANPSRLDVATELPATLEGADLIVVRFLGTPRQWQDGFDVVLNAGVPVVVLGGEQTPDAELMSYSTVPVGTAAEAHLYLAQNGPANLTQMHAFLSDTVLLTGEGFEPPASLPEWGFAERPEAPTGRPHIGILFYRAHASSGNDTFVHDLADAIDATGEAVGVPIYSSSLRNASADLIEAFGTLGALIVTVLAAGGSKPAGASAGGDDGKSVV